MMGKPVTPFKTLGNHEIYGMTFECPQCHYDGDNAVLYAGVNYCPHCGVGIDWKNNKYAIVNKE